MPDKERSSAAELMAVIEGLNAQLKHRQFQVIDQMLRTVKLNLLSPEKILAFARTTFAVRGLLAEWPGFVRRARDELTSRGLDATALLKGLI